MSPSASVRHPFVVASGLGSAAALAAVVQTPAVCRIFGCTPLTPGDWARAAVAAGAAVAGSRLVLPLGDTPLDPVSVVRWRTGAETEPVASSLGSAMLTSVAQRPG